MKQPRLDFSEASSLLEAMCADLENGDAPDFETFKFAEGMLSNAVDKRIEYLHYADSQIEKAKVMAAQWSKRRRNFETLVENIKVEIFDAIKANPNLPYKGTLGSFKIQKNPTCKLHFAASIPPSVDHFPDYVRTVKELDTGAMRADLQAGKEIPGASLEYGEHLRLTLE